MQFYIELSFLSGFIIGIDVQKINPLAQSRDLREQQQNYQAVTLKIKQKSTKMPREAKQDYWISESTKDQKFEDYYTQLTELGR